MKYLKRLIAPAAIAIGTAFAAPAIAADTTKDLMRDLDTQQTRIDRAYQKLERQQAQIDRLRTRLWYEVNEAPTRFRVLDGDNDKALSMTELRGTEYADSFGRIDDNDNDAISLREWNDRMPASRVPYEPKWVPM